MIGNVLQLLRKVMRIDEKRSVQCASELGQSAWPSGAALEHVQEDAASVLCTWSCRGERRVKCRSGKIDLRSKETARVSSGPASTLGIPRREHCTPAMTRVNISAVGSRAAVGRCTCCTSSASAQTPFPRSNLLTSGLLPSGSAGDLRVRRWRGYTIAVCSGMWHCWRAGKVRHNLTN